MRGGANDLSLIEAQRHYRSDGGSELAIQHSGSSDSRDPDWRMFDESIDKIEKRPDHDQGSTYPDDVISLYYWRQH